MAAEQAPTQPVTQTVMTALVVEQTTTEVPVEEARASVAGGDKPGSDKAEGVAPAAGPRNSENTDKSKPPKETRAEAQKRVGDCAGSLGPQTGAGEASEPTVMASRSGWPRTMPRKSQPRTRTALSTGASCGANGAPGHGRHLLHHGLRGRRIRPHHSLAGGLGDRHRHDAWALAELDVALSRAAMAFGDRAAALVHRFNQWRPDLAGGAPDRLDREGAGDRAERQGQVPCPRRAAGGSARLAQRRDAAEH